MVTTWDRRSSVVGQAAEIAQERHARRVRARARMPKKLESPMNGRGVRGSASRRTARRALSGPVAEARQRELLGAREAVGHRRILREEPRAARRRETAARPTRPASPRQVVRMRDLRAALADPAIETPPTPRWPARTDPAVTGRSVPMSVASCAASELPEADERDRRRESGRCRSATRLTGRAVAVQPPIRSSVRISSQLIEEIVLEPEDDVVVRDQPSTIARSHEVSCS